MDLVLAAVDCFGDNFKTLDCLFMASPTSTPRSTAAALEWLSGMDTYRFHRSSVAMNKGAKHMAIQHVYIFSATAAVHLLCCVETRPDLTLWARPLMDAHYRNQANVSLVHRSREGLAPKAWGGEEHERHGAF